MLLNSVSVGALAAQIIHIPVVAPVAPSAFTAPIWTLTDTGTGDSLTVAILSLPDDGGAEITSISYTLNGGANWEDSVGSGGFTIQDLSGQQSVQIRANNEAGAGPWSDIKVATPSVIARAPDAVNGLVATPGNGSISLTHHDPANGGSPITSYIYQYKTRASGTWLDWVGGKVITGLVNDQPYDARAAAVNAIGQGPWGNIAQATPSASAITVADVIFDATLQQYRVSNAAAFPGAVWAWEKQGGGAIAGQTGSTLPYAASGGSPVRATPGGVTASTSNWAGTGTIISGWAEDFEGVPNGTNLNGYNGWTAGRYHNGSTDATENSVEVFNGKIRQTKSPISNSNIWKHSKPTGDYIVHFEGPFDFTQQDFGHFQAIYQRTFFVDYIDGNNYISLAVTSSTGSITSLKKRIAGVETTLLGSATGVFANASTVSFKRVGNRLRVYADKVEIAASVAAGGFDVSGAASNGGVAFYPTTTTGAVQFPLHILDGISVTGVVGKEFNLTASTVAAPSLETPMAMHTMAGTCTPGITYYDWAFTDAQGRIIKDWVKNVAVTSDGNWSIVAPLHETIEGTTGSKLLLRPSSDPTMITAAGLGTIAAYAPMPAEPMIVGINTGTAAGWDEGSGYWNNQKHIGSWQPISTTGATLSTEETILNAEGYPTGELAPNQKELVWKVFEKRTAPHGTAGAHTYTPNFDPAWFDISIHTAQEGVTASVNSTTGVVTANIPAGVKCRLYIRVKPKAGAPLYPNGMWFDGFHAGADQSKVVNPAVHATWGSGAGFGITRFMKTSDAEIAMEYVATWPFAKHRNRAHDFSLSLSAAAELGHITHYCVPVLKDKAAYIAWATRAGEILRDHPTYPSNRIMYVELGNEPWNSVYNNTVTWVVGEAINDLGMLALPAGQPVQNHVRSTVPNFLIERVPDAESPDGDNKTDQKRTIRTAKKGERFLIPNGWSYSVVECIGTTDIGGGEVGAPIGSLMSTRMKGESNSNWLTLAGYPEIDPVRREYFAYMVGVIRDTMRAIAGDRVKSYLDIQAAGGSTVIIDALSKGGAGNEHARKIDSLGGADYAGMNDSDVAKSVLLPPTLTNWKGYVMADDYENAAKGVFNQLGLESTKTINNNKAILNAVYTYCRSIGISPANCPKLITYEGGHHFAYTGMVDPATDGGAMSAKFKTFLQAMARDDRMRQWAILHQARMRQAGFTASIQFVMAEDVTGGTSTTMSFFGIEPYIGFNKSSNGAGAKRYIGMVEEIASTK